MAALIVCAAMLDVIWWVPAHRGAPDDTAAGPQVQSELPKCRKARIQAEIDRLQAELDEVQAEIDALVPRTYVAR